MSQHPSRRSLLATFGAVLAGLFGLSRVSAAPAAPVLPPVTPPTRTTCTYESGRLTSITDPPGLVTTLVYDAEGNWLR